MKVYLVRAFYMSRKRFVSTNLKFFLQESSAKAYALSYKNEMQELFPGLRVVVEEHTVE